jgi:hypothetical protein
MRTAVPRSVALVATAAVILSACGSGIGSAPPASDGPFVISTPTHAPSASNGAVSPLVGQWSLNKTCAMIVNALTKAGLTDLIAVDVPELLRGSVNGGLPPDYDPAKPCADALPPVEHSHTFWRNGMFNSYDENGQQVDDGMYTVIDDHTFRIGDPPGPIFTFTVRGDTIAFDVMAPVPCTTQDCRSGLAWAYSVANPGQLWTRVTSGPHVP